MASNIEIKARAGDFEKQARIASGLAANPPVNMTQVDTFFNVPRGRLKLREFGDGATKIPVPQVDALDTLGAGDVLHGAFCYYLAEGFDRREALRRAAIIASGSCCYFGTHTWKDNE